MFQRRIPIGAEVQRAGGVHFRVWAPRRKTVHVLHEGGGETPLAAEGTGYFSGHVPAARPGTLYRYRLDGGGAFPDPASRFQPEGPHGPSQVVDPAAYRWNDTAWRGAGARGQVIYEMHIGTFTREGTWAAACGELASLARLGITMLEVMPIAEFPGRFGWGYDGVDLFAPTRLYGTPDDFRAFVDCAHGEGLAVILDVVYNHVGPDGNYLKEFSAAYFTDRYKNEWGEPINFDGPGQRAGARILHGERRLLDRRIPSRRPAPGCDATDLRCLSRQHPVRRLAARARDGRGSRDLHRGGERAAAGIARAARRGGRLRPRRPLE
jgi:maltooligosyltrehalose trehalohydrolase